MGLFDDALKNAVPGGNVAAPIAIAAGALLLGKYLSNRGAAPTPGAASPPASSAPQGGGLLGGLNDLVQKFRSAGHGDVVNSWISSGPNQSVSPTQIGSALGQQTISDLARQSGVSEQELVSQLALVLPGLVDKLTPNGRLPTSAELPSHG